MREGTVVVMWLIEIIKVHVWRCFVAKSARMRTWVAKRFQVFLFRLQVSSPSKGTRYFVAETTGLGHLFTLEGSKQKYPATTAKNTANAPDMPMPIFAL